jgi:outer membrane biogenesis lipoprotein LolB
MNPTFLGVLAGIALFLVTACASREPAPAATSTTTTKTIQVPGLPATAPSTTTEVSRTF